MELEYVPELVILTINRFEGTNKIAIPIKLYTKIELDGYPLRLISTVNHTGSTIHGGHYTSYVSRYYYDDDGVCQEKWYMADDSHVREVDRSVVLQDPRVYLALYERVPRKQL
jgi:ubiquitin C-terminal hydrolase